MSPTFARVDESRLDELLAFIAKYYAFDGIAFDRDALTDTIRLAVLTGAIARAADAGIGFPPETSLRLCLVAVAIARAVGLSDEETRDVYHASLLRHAGCTASAHEETRIAGDEIE